MVDLQEFMMRCAERFARGETFRMTLEAVEADNVSVILYRLRPERPSEGITFNAQWIPARDTLLLTVVTELKMPLKKMKEHSIGDAGMRYAQGFISFCWLKRINGRLVAVTYYGLSIKGLSERDAFKFFETQLVQFFDEVRWDERKILGLQSDKH